MCADKGKMSCPGISAVIVYKTRRKCHILASQQSLLARHGDNVTSCNLSHHCLQDMGEVSNLGISSICWRLQPSPAVHLLTVHGPPAYPPMMGSMNRSLCADMRKIVSEKSSHLLLLSALNCSSSAHEECPLGRIFASPYTRFTNKTYLLLSGSCK